MTRTPQILPLLFAALLLAGCAGESIQEHGASSALARPLQSMQAAEVELDIWQKYSFDQRRGKRLYDLYCVVCHGTAGEGDGFNSFNLNPRPGSFADSLYMAAISDATLTEVIARGGRGVNKSVLMPAYQSTLSQDQIRYIVQYIRTLPPNTQ